MTKERFDSICEEMVETMKRYNYNLAHRNMEFARYYLGKFHGYYNALTLMEVIVDYKFDKNGFYWLEIDDSINKFYEILKDGN